MQRRDRVAPIPAEGLPRACLFAVAGAWFSLCMP